MLLILGLAGFNIFLSKMQAFGLFRGKMSSWCSFRCPCLDELGSKSDLNILYLFCCCKICVFHVFRTVRLMDDFIWPEGFFGVVIWFMTKWGVYYWSAKVSLDSMLLILGLAGFNIFNFFLSKTQAFGVFRGKMSSWCSFRRPCLDELGSKSDLNILYLFCCCKMCAFHVIRTVRLMDDWFCSGGFFGVVIGFVFNICIC